MIAPPECIGCGAEGRVLCQDCSGSGMSAFGERCAYCSGLSPRGRVCIHCRQTGAPRFVWITANHETMAQHLVRVYKFGHSRSAVHPLADLMANTFLSYVSPEQARSADFLIVPLPTATSRIRQRGFDHAALLAKALSKRLGLPYAQVLGRLGQSRQVGSSRAARLAQQSGNYFVRQPQRVAGRNLLIIDDVITTGGSLLAASRALRAVGATHVDALVFAKRL